ncbi:MAG: peptidase family protein [Acidimicrobiales bacterium]|nr:peptidase family protein [Acidimicrobiales bacterium]
MLTHLAAVALYLGLGNDAASVTVWRDHVKVFGQADGRTTSGQPMTSDSPLVLASVSKLITALTVARLAERGKIDVNAPVPWDQLFIAHDPEWNDVTVRELLDHTAGMPKAQASWLNQPGSCAVPLGDALASPPRGTRGKWTYSNGNYCALGLLVESVTGTSRDRAADEYVFDPIGISGPHLTTTGLLPGDGPYVQGVARLERLGGAGTWMASTDDVAEMLDSVTPEDLQTMRFPGIITDQYGWGHTGTVDGARSCAWVMEGGRTVIVATVAGQRPSTGGKLCDIVVPALATDLGIWADKPARQPD